MSQKSRADLTSVIGSNIYDNTNKEILAAMVRAVLNDFRDSKFNLIDDELKGVTYRTVSGVKQTLEQYLNALVGAIPLWGSTDYFDIASTTGNIQPYSDNGIVSSMTYIRLGSSDCEITVNLSKSVDTRKVMFSIYTESSNMQQQNDVCTPVIRKISSTTFKVGLREVSGETQKIRLEILAFKVTT